MVICMCVMTAPSIAVSTVCPHGCPLPCASRAAANRVLHTAFRRSKSRRTAEHVTGGRAYMQRRSRFNVSATASLGRTQSEIVRCVPSVIEWFLSAVSDHTRCFPDVSEIVFELENNLENIRKTCRTRGVVRPRCLSTRPPKYPTA